MTKEEMARRRKTIGSSDVPAICGLSKWKDSADVLQSKISPEAIMDDPSFILGHKLERPIAELAADMLVARGTKFHGLLPGWTVELGWRSATPDFFAMYEPPSSRHAAKKRVPRFDEAELIEVKNVGFRQLPSWGFGEFVPDYVRAQVQWQMLVFDYPHAYVAALLGGAEVRVYKEERDLAWIAELEKTCFAWWERHLSKPSWVQAWARVKHEQLNGRRWRAA